MNGRDVQRIHIQKHEQLWEVRGRGKDGRPRMFADPQDLWAAACDYFRWADGNPWTKLKIVSKESGLHPGDDVTEEPCQRSYSMDALKIYLGVSHSFFSMSKAAYKGIDEEYVVVIEEIERVVRDQQIEGAKNGTYNANLIARIQGIAEKVESTNKNINVEITPTKEEVQKIAKDLEDDC